MASSVARIVVLAGALTAIAAAAAVIDYRSVAVLKVAEAPASVGTQIAAPGVVEGATEGIMLRPEISGSVARLYVAAGDRVAPGQPLVQLDDRSARWRLEAAEARLASALAERDRLVSGARQQERDEARALHEAAESRLSQATNALRRVEQLEDQRAVNGQEADDARSRVATLRAELAAASARLALVEAPARQDEVRLADARVAAGRAEVESAKVMLDKTVLKSPCNAQVLDLNAKVGELLTPDLVEPVVVLCDTRRLRVRVFVEELDAPRVAIGAPVSLSADGLPGQEIRGVVAELSPRMTAKQVFSGKPDELYDTKTREVLVDIDDNGQLIFGLRVDARIQTDVSTHVALDKVD